MSDMVFRGVTLFMCFLLIGWTNSSNAQHASDTSSSAPTYSAYELLSSFYDDNFHPFTKGNAYVGITFTVQDRKQENTSGLLQDVILGDELNYRINSKGGYFIGNYVMTGLSYTYSQNKFTGTVLRDSDTLSVNSIERGHTFSPFLRTYFPLTSNERLSFFIELNVSAGFSNSLRRETTGLDQIDKRFTDEFIFGVGISPGINFFAMQNFSFEVQLNIAGYELRIIEEERNETDVSRDTRNNVNFNIDLLSLNLGIAYFINTGNK